MAKTERFSREAYDKYAKEFFNNINKEVEIVTQRKEDGAVEKKVIKPVEEFRKTFIQPIVESMGVDAAEAAEVVNKEINKIGNFYELQSELNYGFMQETGRRIDFLPKEDFEGGYYLVGEGEKETKYRIPNRPDENGNVDPDAPVKYVEYVEGAHTKLKVKSKLPKNLKKKK